MGGRLDQPPSGVRPRGLTTAEAAGLLGVTRATVVAWARQGRFGAVQYGQRGIYRFDREEIEAFVARSRRRARPPEGDPRDQA